MSSGTQARRRRHVVVEAAVLVVGEEERRRGQCGLATKRADDARRRTPGRPATFAGGCSSFSPSRRGSRGRRTRPAAACPAASREVLGDRRARGRHVRRGRRRRSTPNGDVASSRSSSVTPACVEQVEDRQLRELRSSTVGEVVADVAERRARRADSSGSGSVWPEHRREVAVARRERAVQPVVEGQVVLRVVAHRAAAGRVRRRSAFCGGEAVHRAAVPLPVRAVPGVVEVRHLAVVASCGTAGSAARRSDRGSTSSCARGRRCRGCSCAK